MKHYSQLSRGMIITAALVFPILANQASALVYTTDDWQLLEAQLIALDLSGELRPPADLTGRIMDDLAAIRAAYPDETRVIKVPDNVAVTFDSEGTLTPPDPLQFAEVVTHIRYMPSAAPNQLIVGLTDEAMAQFNAGQYHELDALNTLYGVIDIDMGPTIGGTSLAIMLLTFDQNYNTQVLADLYIQAQLWGLRSAESNRYGGDGSTIQAGPPFYTFSAGWGDCPSGCINKQEWHYRVDDGHVTVIPEPATLSLLGIGGLAMIRRRRKHHTLQ